jgi:hypothetical protein
MMFDEDTLSTFVAITNASRSEAEHFLEASLGEIEAAVQLFFDNARTGREIAGAAANEFPSDSGPSGFGAQPVEPPPATGNEVEYGIRRPDAVRRERLFDHSAMAMHEAQISMQRRSGAVQSIAFGDAPMDTQGIGRGLGSVYQPPTDLLSGDNIEEYEPSTLMTCKLVPNPTPFHTCRTPAFMVILNVANMH